MRQMKIVLTVNAAWNIWNFRKPLVEALIANGHQVTLLAPRDDSVPKLEALGCQFRHLDMGVKSLNPVPDFVLLLRLRRVFKDIRPDVVLSFTIKNNIFGALAAKSVGVPFVPNVTGLGTAFLSGPVLERLVVRLYKTAFRGLPIVFFQNEDDRELFLNRGMTTENQVLLLPGSGINLEYFATAPYPVKDDAPRFLMIARLLRDKGVFEYVEAARLVKATYPQVRFQLLGATDAQNRTAVDRDTVLQWDQDGVIEYLGTTDDVRPAIAEAHCVVLPSYREGAPRTLIEAAAMARPLIATKVPGCRAVIDEGTTGFLCDAKNAQSLAGACRKFLEQSHQARIAMGRAGRAKMEREYDKALVVDAYKSAIKQLAA